MLGSIFFIISKSCSLSFKLVGLSHFTSCLIPSPLCKTNVSQPAAFNSFANSLAASSFSPSQSPIV